MSYSMYEVVLGSLLHDIGKLIQRAFDRPQDLTGQSYDLESTLCPLKDGRYTHRHVLFTEAFFELTGRVGPIFPEGIDPKMVSQIACFHHKPESCDLSVAGAWMCAVADRYSAGMDRKADEEHEKSSKTFRTTPIRCIFDELILDEKALGKPKRHAYRLALLDPEDEGALMPVPWPENGRDDELPGLYRKVFDSFRSDYTSLARARYLSLRLFEEALLGILERTTWAVPSSTIDLPDISLFDHTRTTAAIAASLYRFHEARGELEDISAIKDRTPAKFRFLAGDLSGIQATLFNLASQGVAGVNKILRARSFLLGATAEAAALQLLEALGLPTSSVIQQAGGRFLILVPALDEVERTVEDLSSRWDELLLEDYTGSLALNLALSPPFSGDEFGSGRLSAVMAALGQALEESKQRPLSHCSQGVLKREFPLGTACSSCGTRPAESLEGDETHCPTCHKEVKLGRRLVRSDLILFGRNLPEKYQPVKVLGLDLSVLEKGVDPPWQNALSIRKSHLFETPVPWTVRLLANHVPTFKDPYELQDPRYEGIEEEDTRPGVGELKTFMHIAAEALEFDEEKRFRGKPYLGLLKADVDYLGFLFQYGLRRRDKVQDRFTISRLAQLSRMMDLYFTGYLKGLLHREFPSTYTVYAGGDDLLLIGPWRQTLKLAQRINETFRAYTGENPNITLSAGLTLLKANYPVNRAVWEAEEFLETAKEGRNAADRGRNRIQALIDWPMPWDRYAQRLEDAEWVHERMQETLSVGTGFVYHIMSIAEDAKAVARGDVRRANWRSRLAYHLARNIKGYDKNDKERRIVEWLERLGLDDHFNFTKEHRSLYEWRLPLTIALYRNRR